MMSQPGPVPIYQPALLSGDFDFWFEIALYHFLYNDFETKQVGPNPTDLQVNLAPAFAFYFPLVGVGKTEWTQKFQGPPRD